MATHDLLEISDPIVSEFECDSDGTDYIPSSDSDDSGDEIVPSPKKNQKKESSQFQQQIRSSNAASALVQTSNSEAEEELTHALDEIVWQRAPFKKPDITFTGGIEVIPDQLTTPLEYLREMMSQRKPRSLRPWLESPQSSLKKLLLEEHSAVDEVMVPFKGRSNVKQFTRNKPHKWGFKLWGRAEPQEPAMNLRTADLSSSCPGTEPITKVKRYDKKQKSIISLECPAIVIEYNKFMGGIDLCDSLTALYQVQTMVVHV
ncbi:hypothetical protein RRG08_024554 [Elysia crispata]|uniref:PiggyBac transposable element-derived protein domain-containing protein n=1 Tax=Elysia crispata TaxID=231223 RepID=A0AAE1DT77_9GAST|nr:hypothetical protein RRG08_024554 [Elysia crispata]